MRQGQSFLAHADHDRWDVARADRGEAGMAKDGPRPFDSPSIINATDTNRVGGVTSISAL
jgi:hypothetical protein